MRLQLAWWVLAAAVRWLWTLVRRKPVCEAECCGRPRDADAIYCAHHEAADRLFGPAWTRRRGLKPVPPSVERL